jgi:hypothetical protein
MGRLSMWNEEIATENKNLSDPFASIWKLIMFAPCRWAATHLFGPLVSPPVSNYTRAASGTSATRVYPPHTRFTISPTGALR